MKFKWNDRTKKAMLRGVQRGVASAAVIVQNEIKEKLTSGGASNIGSGGKSSPPGGPPAVNTGHLLRSIQIDGSKIKTANPFVRIGTNVTYAPIHEFGGRILPKNAKALAVPIGIEGRRASRQAGWRSDKNSAGRIRSLDLSFIPRKGKAPLLAETHSDGSMTPLFVLMKSVTIPARPFMRPSLIKAKKRMLKVAGQEIRRAITSAA